MNEPVNDYCVTQMVQDLENDLYDSKERIQRLRRQNDELTAENERLRDGIEVIRDRCVTLAKSAQTIGMGTLAHEMGVNAKALAGLLEGGIE